jgi:hypothetical protein
MQCTENTHVLASWFQDSILWTTAIKQVKFSMLRNYGCADKFCIPSTVRNIKMIDLFIYGLFNDTVSSSDYIV